MELAIGHQIHRVPLILLRQVEDLLGEELHRLLIEVLGGIGRPQAGKHGQNRQRTAATAP